MAANRFNQILPNQSYVSTYIPLPLEELYAMGKDADKNLDTKIKATESSLDPFSKLKLNTAFRVYDPKSPKGESTYSTQYLEDLKNEAVSSLDTERETLVSDYIGGKVDKNTFDQKNRDIILRAKNTYNKLAAYQPVVEAINKNNEEIAKNEAFGKDRSYGTKLLEYNTKLAKDFESGNVGGYTPVGIAKEIKMEDVINTDATNWKESDMGSRSYSDGQYIHDLNTKGITGTRVYDYANQMWENPSHSARAYAELSLNDYLNSTGASYDDKVDYKDYKRDSQGNILKDKSGNAITETKKGKLGDIFLEQEKHKYASSLADKIVHQTLDTKMSGDPFGLEDYKAEKEVTKDPWTTFTPQQPGEGSDRDSRLTNGLPANIKENMMYKDGKLVSRKEESEGFWSTLWDNIVDYTTAVLNPSSAPKIVAERAAKVKLDTKHAVEANKDIKPLLLNYGIATGKIKSENDLNNPKVFNQLKDEYSTHLGDAIVANRETLFDQTTAQHATEAILPTADKDGNILSPNMMGSTSVYSLDGKLIDDQSLMIGGKILAPDTKNPGRLIMASRNGKQYSIDPNVPDLKLVTQNIADFDRNVIERVATGGVTNSTESLNSYYSAINAEIDKIPVESKIKESIKLNYIGKINGLVGSGYKMTTAYYGGNEVPVAIRFNPDGTVEKKVIAEVEGRGATIMDIGEYKSYKTQESFRNAGILPQLNNRSNKQYEANTIR